jgi:gliding motility-associated-like protein
MKVVIPSEMPVPIGRTGFASALSSKPPQHRLKTNYFMNLKFYSLRPLVFALSLLTALLMGSSVQAQFVPPNAFLQGQFTEVGCNQCGVFGSSVNPGGLIGPLGTPYHPNVLVGLGFVADSDQDGWAIGFPQYCGDYFVPGSPVEGWALQVGGTVLTNENNSCGVYEMPGTITSYTDLGTERQSVWEGTANFGASTVGITQTTILPVNKLYFIAQVELCNTGATPIPTLYYARNVDPDNDQPWSGSFVTTNTIVSQPPGTCDALVTATGNTYGCFLGLGARDTIARVSYGSFFMGDPAQIWAGTGPHSSSGTNVADEAISLAFRIDNLAPGDCRMVSFAYVLDAADLAEALDATAAFQLFADTIDITNDDTLTICEGNSVSLEIGGASDYFWQWTPGVGLDVDTGLVVIASPTSTTTYTALGTGGLCDTLERQITIVVDSLPDGVTAGLDTAICQGDTIQLAAVGSTISIWDPFVNMSADDIPDPFVWPDVTTDYIYSTYDENPFCAVTDTVRITVNPKPIVDAGPDLSICFGDTVYLNGMGAFDYEWSPPDFLDNANIPGATSIPDTTITYVLEGTTAEGCVDYDTMTITVNPLPVVDAGPDWTIDLVQNEFAEFDVLAPTAISWNWSPTDGLSNPSIGDPDGQPEQSTTYIVAVTDANGCINYDTVFVEVLNEFTIIIPDAFTPNGDGLNDVFHPVVIGLVEFLDVSIYNRWGELVYYSQDLNSGWDGTYQGKEQELATYVVVVRILDTKGNPAKSAGTTTIIR